MQYGEIARKIAMALDREREGSKLVIKLITIGVTRGGETDKLVLIWIERVCGHRPVILKWLRRVS
jgi:hypothetical protein